MRKLVRRPAQRSLRDICIGFKMFNVRLVVIVMILVWPLNLSAQENWRNDPSGSQTIFIETNNEWGFSKQAYFGVRVDDKYNGRSETIRWGTVVSNSPTAKINYQNGKTFSYQGTVLDQFDRANWPENSVSRDKKIVEISTKHGKTATVRFSIFYRGYNKVCQYFAVIVPDNKTIFKGYLCGIDESSTPPDELGRFVNSLIVR